MIKFQAFDGEKMLAVQNICFNGKPMVTVQYNPVIKLPLEDVKLLQFIGKRDKNGTEICQDDIIRWNYHVSEPNADFTGIVEYHHKVLKVGYERDEVLFVGFIVKGIGSDDWYTEMPNLDDIEVIGNRHTTPELLEAAT